ncbi:MAG: lysylphosphatidylglycerol synthase transmembrane domain-containing protein [Pedococcus sp.]
MDRNAVRMGQSRLAVPLRAAAAVTLALAVLWWSLPKVAGVGWGAIGATLGQIPARVALGLALLWAGGLLAHSFVLTAALPGLSRRRALTLSLTGSAVSNVVPFGGAIGVALNFTMVRAWRFHKGAYATFVMVTNVWDVLAKLALPLVAVVLMTAAGALPGRALQAWAIVGATVLLTVVAAGAALLSSDRLARGAAHLVASGARRTRRRSQVSAAQVERGLLEARDRVRGIVRARWPQLTTGMAAYLALQGALLWCCLHAVGIALPLYAVMTALATDRLLSIIPLTPGGAGFAEVGTAAALIGFGADPLGVAAGVLLYRAFTFLLEIPVGGVWLGCWLALRPRTVAVAA